MRLAARLLSIAVVLALPHFAHAQARQVEYTVRAADPAVTSIALVMPRDPQRRGWSMRANAISTAGDIVTFAVPARLLLEDQQLDLVLRAAPGAPPLAVVATTSDKNGHQVIATATGTAIRIFRGAGEADATVQAERIRTYERP